MIRFEGVSYTYPEAPSPVFADVSFEVGDGEFVLVVGRSGAGKSTLLRCLNGLVPHFSGGLIGGRIRVAGLDPVESGPAVMCEHVGFVFQDPEAQFVVDVVEDEIAFALENMALPRAVMQQRVEEVLDLLALTSLRARPIETLSGGEKQRVAIAAALALRPKVLVLDEPTSQLAPDMAHELLDTLVHLSEALGLTIVLAEHRLERVLPYCDTILYLEHVASTPSHVRVGPPREILPLMEDIPPVVTLGKALGWTPLPLSVEDAVPWAQTVRIPPGAGTREIAQRRDALQAPYLRVESLTAGYEGRAVVHDVSLALSPGEIAVLLGHNGVGKSTLLRAMVGLIRPMQGRVWIGDRDVSDLPVAEICRHVAYLPQDPSALLFADTVLDELLTTLHNHDLKPEDVPVPPRKLLEQLGLAPYRDAYPRDLSVGERQRVALAAILVTGPRAILLDEPTRGLDYSAKAALLALLRRWRDGGGAVLLVTHDVELVALAADRVMVMEAGRIVAEGKPAQVLRAAPDFSPQIAHLFPTAGWLTAQDVLDGLGVGRDESQVTTSAEG